MGSVKHNEHLARAKAGLISDQPFFASLLLGMPIEQNDSIPTMATDGERVIYNANFVESLTLSELTFVLAHEVLHCVFQHMLRRGDRNPNKWNIAADYVINEVLVDDKVGTMPEGGLYNPKLTKEGGGTAEGIYKLLPQDAENKGAGDKGGAMDRIFEPGASPKSKPQLGKQGKGKGDAEGHIDGRPIDDAEKSEREGIMNVRIRQAHAAAKMQGKMSANLEGLVKQLTKTRVDWKSVLRRFLTERAKTDFSFARPKRRFLADDLYLPGLTGEKMGAIVVAVDTSGSVGIDELEVFAAEIKGIHQDVRPVELKVIYFDSEIKHVDTYSPDDDVTITEHGGGGTAFSPIFEKIETFDAPPVACVVLTDLECDDFGKTPEYPVLWVCTTDLDIVPFGDVARLEIGE